MRPRFPIVHSLGLRLLLTLIFTTAVALGTVAVVTRGATRSEFQRYVDRSQGDVQAAVAQLGKAVGLRVVIANREGRVLADSGGELEGWETLLAAGSLTPLLAEADSAVSPGQAKQASQAVAIIHNTRIELRGPSEAAGTLPARSDSDDVASSLIAQLAPGAADAVARKMLIAAPLMTTLDAVPLPAGSPGGAGNSDVLYFRRAGGQPGIYGSENAFIQSVNRSLVVAVVASGLAAVALAWLVSRRILRPVYALTLAAEGMARGDLSQRVPAPYVRAQDELGGLARAFNTMADNLARTEQLRRSMVTDVAHELRTPLTNLRGYLEALRDGVTRPTPPMLASLHEEALLLTRLVDDLRDLALADAGQLTVDRRPVALHEVVDRIVAVAQPTAAAQGVSIDTDVPADLPPVNADAARLGQVLHNLLSNALRHTPELGSVTVAATVDEANITLSVRDTGTGIAPEHLPYVFERFYRADPSRARATGGSGIGLAVVRQVVEAHGGHVWAESAAGLGSTFSFTLPLSDTPHTAERSLAA